MEYLIAGAVTSGIVFVGIAAVYLMSSRSFTARIDRRRRARQRFLKSWWTASTEKSRNGS